MKGTWRGEGSRLLLRLCERGELLLRRVIGAVVVEPVAAMKGCVVLVKHAFTHPRHVRVFFGRCLGRVMRLKMGSVNVMLLVSFFVNTMVAVRVGLGVRDP